MQFRFCLFDDWNIFIIQSYILSSFNQYMSSKILDSVLASPLFSSIWETFKETFFVNWRPSDTFVNHLRYLVSFTRFCKFRKVRAILIATRKSDNQVNLIFFCEFMWKPGLNQIAICRFTSSFRSIHRPKLSQWLLRHSYMQEAWLLSIYCIFYFYQLFEYRSDASESKWYVAIQIFLPQKNFWISQ